MHETNGMSGNANLERSIGRLEGKLDQVVDAMNRQSTSIDSLREAFDVLEKGRLSNLEVKYAELNTKVRERARTTAVWVALVVSISIAVISAILEKVV